VFPSALCFLLYIYDLTLEAEFKTTLHNESLHGLRQFHINIKFDNYVLPTEASVTSVAAPSSVVVHLDIKPTVGRHFIAELLYCVGDTPLLRPTRKWDNAWRLNHFEVIAHCLSVGTSTRTGDIFCDLPHIFPISKSFNDRFKEIILDVGRQ
jgi:hypothetical protein